jgi:hypothetical protein
MAYLVMLDVLLRSNDEIEKVMLLYRPMVKAGFNGVVKVNGQWVVKIRNNDSMSVLAA